MIGTEGDNNLGNLDLTGSGTTQPLMLAANGLILCKELLVKTSTPPWPDYVFEPGYALPKLLDLEKTIAHNKMLPGMPSASDIEKHGVNVVDLEAKLLKKVEELTLYVIELQKDNLAMKHEIKGLKRHEK